MKKRIVSLMLVIGLGISLPMTFMGCSFGSEDSDSSTMVAEEVLESMIDEDSELITIFYGKDVDESKIEEFTEKLEEKYEECDVQFYKGDQPLYYFIMAVE